MSAVLENIRTRRAVRSYSDKQVELDKLELVLEAGTWAPTGMNKQAPVIIAVQEPETLQQLIKLNAAVMGTDNNPYYGAPTIVLVLADPAVGTFVEDASCVLQNMMLAAHDLGLASCWIHRPRQMFATEEGKALLRKWGLPETLTGVGSLALGYAADKLPDPKPRKEGYIVKVL